MLHVLNTIASKAPSPSPVRSFVFALLMPADLVSMIRQVFWDENWYILENWRAVAANHCREVLWRGLSGR